MIKNLNKVSRILSIQRCFYSKPTIFALSSGQGKCGVAVIRVSGPEAGKAAQLLSGTLPKPRKAVLRKFYDPMTKKVLDRGLLLWFPGEDVCEFQVHGGIAVVTSMLNALGKINCSPAEPGEFTKRAFYAGKLDLTSVEGLADLINAETELQRQQALIQMEGGLFDVYTKWTNSLLKCLASLEAFIDFDEDENLGSEIIQDTNKSLKAIQLSISKHLNDNRRGERLRSGVKLAIIGPPNAGKSSLLNLLSQAPTAIVSSIPGTTRDIVKAHLDISGYPVNVMDTAGMRETYDKIELEGISRTKVAASEADIILMVLDALTIKKYLKDSTKNISHYLIDNKLDIMDKSKKVMIIINKMDLISSELNIPGACFISCKNSTGIDTLLNKLSSNLETLCGSASLVNPSCSQARHRYCLEESLKAIERYFELKDRNFDIAVQDIRNAIYQLGKITGKVSVEDVLDVIFKDFCIGK